jgi:hypothetical protein
LRAKKANCSCNRLILRVPQRTHFSLPTHYHYTYAFLDSPQPSPIHSPHNNNTKKQKNIEKIRRVCNGFRTESGGARLGRDIVSRKIRPVVRRHRFGLKHMTKLKSSGGCLPPSLERRNLLGGDFLEHSKITLKMALF